jgi:UDP-N-acetylmuramate--alanine ligase
MSLISDLYANAFVGADLIVVTDIYASGTTQIAGVTGQLVVDAILRANPKANVEYKATREQLIDFLDGQLKSGDLCISMGCGDISSLPSELILRGQV